jgi:hypothetical protein
MARKIKVMSVPGALVADAASFAAGNKVFIGWTRDKANKVWIKSNEPVLVDETYEVRKEIALGNLVEVK